MTYSFRGCWRTWPPSSSRTWSRASGPSGLPVGALLHEGAVGGAGFVSGHATVAAAMATAAAPYLSRRKRRVVWALAWTVALARIYVGAHLPLDVVGGLAAGWAVGSLVHWVMGVPRWKPPAAAVARLLQRYGLPVHHLVEADVDAGASHPFTAVDAAGRPVFVKVLDPDRYERDWLFRLARLVAVRDVKDADALAPLGGQAEHEAVTAFTARQRGVRVAPVLLARGSDRGAVVAQEFVTGRTLDRLPPDALTDELLGRVWGQVALLHAARIAHRDLGASSVLVDDDALPWIVDFGNAETGADDDMLAGDVAELMASLSLRTEPAAVVHSAIHGLGTEIVTAALTQLAPLVLSAATRDSMRAQRSRLTELRREVRRQVGLSDPARLQFGPAGPAAISAVAASAAVVFGGYALVTGAPELWDAIEINGWRWLGGAAVLAALARGATAAAAAVAIDRRLALGRVVAATIVADGATLRRGATDRERVASRFLERAGMPPPAASEAVDRFDAGAAVAAVVVGAITVVLVMLEDMLPDLQAPAAPVTTACVGTTALFLALTGQMLASRHVLPGELQPVPPHLGVVPPYRKWRRSSWRSAGTGRWTAQLSWSAFAVVLEASALAAALHAGSGRVPVLATAGVYGIARLMWALLPLTGGPGLAEASLLFGLTAVGAPLPAAGIAVLSFRALTFWLPAALGWALSGRLERRLLL